MTSQYAIISDVHQNPLNLNRIIREVKDLGLDGLIINGDVGNTPEVITFSLIQAVNSELPVYVQPGSHETINGYELAIKKVSSEYSNLINVLDQLKIETSDHHLVFLPGSDWTAGGEYLIKPDLPTGDYFPQGSLSRYQGLLSKVHVENMNDLTQRVTDPGKTIIFCHVPPKFDNPINCVDMAYFCQKGDEVMPGIAVESMIKQRFGNLPNDVIVRIAAANGLLLKKENRGNEFLKQVFYKLGVTKAVSGHFHESVHRANDQLSNPVPPGTLVSELFYNASHADAGLFGVLTVNGELVSYQNITV